AWLDPALLARWFGPDDLTVTVASVDEQVGGVHQVELLGTDGAHVNFVSVIEELVPDERIVFTFKFDPTAHETKLTITFRDAGGGRTALRLEHERITAEGTLDGHSVERGWGQTLAKLQVFCETTSRVARQEGEQA
ncbi:MAG: SRPBCC family protein, partial [Ilumatobacteraceae bacterium]